MLHHEYFESKYGFDNAETIVLIHGLGGNYRVWKYQIPILQERYNVLAIDLPSHYEGNIKLSDMQVTLDAIAQKIIEVLDYYNLKQCPFMGVSLGTIFVKYIEAFYPDYVSYGILVGAVATINALCAGIVRFLARVGDKLPFKLVYRLFSWIIMPRKDSKKSREIFRKCALALNRKEFKLYMIVFKQAFKFNKQFANDEHFENIYISGDKDKVFFKGVLREALRTKARFIEIEDCGHVCNIDKTQKFDELMERITDTQLKLVNSINKKEIISI